MSTLIQKISQAPRLHTEPSDLLALFNQVLTAAKEKSISTLTDLYLDEGIDISCLQIYGDTILSRMAYEITMPKIDILNAELNHEFNTLIHFYRHMLEGIIPPLMPANPILDGEQYKEISNDIYKRDIMVGLLKRGDIHALDLTVMQEKFYLFCCGRFGLSDIIGWFLVVALDAKLKNLGFHIEQFSPAAMDTQFILNQAIKGYALGGFIQKVDNFILSGADINNAVEGFALGGYTQQVQQLLERKASRSAAIKGYIYSGIFHKLEEFFLQDNHLMNIAIQCLKNTKHCFHTIFVKLSKHHPDYARLQMGRQKAVLRLIAPINNAELRAQFLEKITSAGVYLTDTTTVLQIAEQINMAIQSGKTFDEAYATHPQVHTTTAH